MHEDPFPPPCGASRRIWLARAGALLAATLLPRPVPAAARPLRIGIIPYNSAVALLSTHRPLTAFLEQRLDRPVQLYTARDYTRYVATLEAGDYDLAIAPPHFAGLVLDRYTALYAYKAWLEPRLLVPLDSPIRNARDLRGKRIAVPQRIAFITIVGAQWLAEQGLEWQRDYTPLDFTTHGAAIAAVAHGQSDAALTTLTLLGQVPPDIRARVRVIDTGIRVPNLMFLARNDLGGETIAALRTALGAFPDSPEGHTFFAHTHYLGFVPADAGMLAAAARYAERFRLSATPPSSSPRPP